jgi:PPOX class probable F420-dependent enzyme
MRSRVRAARVARLATVNAHGAADLVPVTFALVDDDTIVTAVDHKPKRTTALARLRNIRAHAGVTFLVDHYDDADWDALWWVRIRAVATVAEPGEPDHQRAAAVLGEKYPAYRDRPPAGPAIVARVTEWHGWAAGGVSPRGPG